MKTKTETINIKVDSKLKREARRVAEGIGLTLSSVLKAYLVQIIRDKEVRFSLSAEKEPSEELINMIREAEEDFKKGKTKSFAASRDALKHIDAIISRKEKRADH
jgi:addiction module RelB/DinJ family antitoxin